VVVIVVPGVDAYRGVSGADTAARHDGGCRVVLRFREQLRHAEVEPLAHLLQLVVSEGQAIVLHLGKRRKRNAGALAHLFQGPVVTHAQAAKQASQSGLPVILLVGVHRTSTVSRIANGTSVTGTAYLGIAGARLNGRLLLCRTSRS